tara:strand:+ start:322 stop:486 length:165 start_codon:yes stop_codon:yes gene_type:complete
MHDGRKISFEKAKWPSFNLDDVDAGFNLDDVGVVRVGSAHINVAVDSLIGHSSG